GIQRCHWNWIPVFAGMTKGGQGEPAAPRLAFGAKLWLLRLMLRPFLIGLALIALPAVAQADPIRAVSEKSSFQIALEGKLPVMVLFQGKNCAACRAVELWIDQMSGELDGKVDMVSLDIDENPYTKDEFGVE